MAIGLKHQLGGGTETFRNIVPFHVAHESVQFDLQIPVRESRQAWH